MGDVKTSDWFQEPIKVCTWGAQVSLLSLGTCSISAVAKNQSFFNHSFSFFHLLHDLVGLGGHGPAATGQCRCRGVMGALRLWACRGLPASVDAGVSGWLDPTWWWVMLASRGLRASGVLSLGSSGDHLWVPPDAGPPRRDHCWSLWMGVGYDRDDVCVLGVMGVYVCMGG